MLLTENDSHIFRSRTQIITRQKHVVIGHLIGHNLEDTLLTMDMYWIKCLTGR